MIRLFITLIVLGLAAFGGMVIYNSTINATGNLISEIEDVVDILEFEDIGETEIKIFVLTGENFKFVLDGEDNPEIRVNEGDKVRIEFISTSGFHDWVLEEFGAATAKVGENGETYVEFIAGEKGTFEYYCSVGAHRDNGMKGVFVVE